MITSKISIAGKDYLLAMSTRVMVKIEKTGGSWQKMMEDRDHIMTNLSSLLMWMSEAGRVYAAMTTGEKYEAITEEFLMDAVGPDDLINLKDALTEVLIGDRKVDAEPPKNAEAAQAEAPVG